MKDHVYVSQALKYALMTAAAMAIVVIFGSSAFAATRTWDGDTDLNWNTAANWDSDTLPVAGDDLVFDTDATDFDGDADFVGDVLNNDIAAATSFNSITINGSGVAPQINGNSFDVAGGGITNNTSYTLDIDADVTLSADAVYGGTGSIRFGGDFDPSGNTLTANRAVIFEGTVSGTGGIIAASYASFESANTYTGSVTANSGASVQVCVPTAWGTGTHTISDGARVTFPVPASGSTTTIPGDFTIGGSGLGSNEWEAAIGFHLGCSSGGGSGGGVDPDDPFEPASLTARGNITFSGTVTLTGDTTIGANSSIYNKSVITFEDVTLGGFTIDRVQPFVSTLSINGTNQTALDPVETDYDDDQPTAQVYVYPGNVVTINGTRNDVAVYEGATLRGTGTVDELVVFSGGTLAPGLSPGCLTSGNLVLSGTFEVEIAGTTVCDDYDQTDVTGTVDVTGGTLDVTFLSGFEPAAGDEFIIIANDGADDVTGEFTGLAEGATVTVGTTDFTISYAGGDGNDVVLTAGGDADTPDAPDTGFFLFNSAQPLAFVLSGLAALVVLGLNRQSTIFSSRR